MPHHIIWILQAAKARVLACSPDTTPA